MGGFDDSQQLVDDHMDAQRVVRALAHVPRYAPEAATVLGGGVSREQLLNEQLLRAIFDHALDAILLANDCGKYVAANEAASTLFGIERSALLGRTITEFAAPGFETPDEWRSFLERGALRGEFPLLRGDGVRLLLDYSAVANILPGLHLSILRDITAEREAAAAVARAESALRHAQKIEAVGRFASGVAHDFNNLLTVVMGFAELAQSGLDPAHPVGVELTQIQLAAAKGAALTSQLQGVSRRHDVLPSVVDLRTIAVELASMCKRLLGEDIRFLVSTSAEPLPVFVHASQIEQIIMNLVVNARDAMPSGGQVKLDCSEHARFSTDDGDPRAHRYARLSVTDTGIGMDEVTLARAREPFFTTKAVGAGSGLGLSIVDGIVKQAGGRLHLSSQVGKGTACEVLFPLENGPPLEVRADPAPPYAPATGTETVLLVEDDDSVRAVLQRLLQSHGYTVLDACNAGEALLICEQYGSTIHLLLVDVVLPWLSGPQLAERLAPLCPALKVLYMSGHDDKVIRGRGPLGASAPCLRKPIPKDELARAVRRLLDA